MKQWVLIVAAVAVAGLVGLIAWIAAGNGPTVEAASLSAPDSASPSNPPPRSALAPVDDDRRSPSAPETAASSATSSSPAAAIELPEGQGLDVLVLDKKSEQPIANASLTY